MSDPFNKEAFMKHLDAMIPDDSRHFEFMLQWDSRAGVRPAAVPGAREGDGLVVTEVTRSPMVIGDSLARYRVEGKL